MNVLATHVGDGRWVVETPRPVAEADKVFTVPSPSMMPAGAPAVWSRDGAWVAPVPGTVPGTAPSSGFGAPSMQVPSEAWFEGAGEFAEVPESDDHGGCGTNEAFEAAYLAAAAEASARGVIEPGERREALIDALMEEAAQAERAKFQAMVASGEVKVWEDDEDESRFDPQGRPFELPKRLWQRLEEDAATEDVTSSSTSSDPSPSPWLRPTPANPLVPPATWSVGEQLRRCGHAVPLYTWTTTKLQGPGGAKVDYSGDPARMKAEAETRVKAKLLTQMHAPPRTLGRATKLQMVDTEAGWAGLVTPVGTKKMSVLGWQAFTKLGKPDETTDDGSDRLHWPLAKAAPGGSGPQASSSTSLGTPGLPPDPPSPPLPPPLQNKFNPTPIPPPRPPGDLASPGPTQGPPLPPDPPKPPTFGDKNLGAGEPQLPPIGPGQISGNDCDDGEVLPEFPGYSYALDIEAGGPDFTGVVDRVVEYLHDGWWALERVQRYLPEERALAWNDERGASSAGNPSLEHHFGPYSKALLRELQKLLAEAAERWVLGFPKKTTAPTASFKVGVGSDGTFQPSTSPLRRQVRFRWSNQLGVCTSVSGIRRTEAAQRVYIDVCPTWPTRSADRKVRSLLELTIFSFTKAPALVDWLMERSRAQGKSAPYPLARCDEERSRTPYCAPPSSLRTLRSDVGWVDELLRAGYWATYGAWRALADSAGDTPADMKSAWNEEMVVFGPTGAPRSPDLAVYDPGDITTYHTFGESSVGERIPYQAPKNLQRRLSEFSYRRYQIILRALTDVGEHFIRDPKTVIAHGGSTDPVPGPMQVVVVDGKAGPGDELFFAASKNELRVSRDARMAPRQQVLASLVHALLTLVPGDGWVEAFTWKDETSGGAVTSANSVRTSLSRWVSSRYLWLGLCGVATCSIGIDMYRVPLPPLPPRVDTSLVPEAEGAVRDAQVALTIAALYLRAFQDEDLSAPGVQSGTQADVDRSAQWSGNSPTFSHRDLSLFTFLKEGYSALLRGEIRDLVRNALELLRELTPPPAASAAGAGTGPLVVGYRPYGAQAGWEPTTPRTLRVALNFSGLSREQRVEEICHAACNAAWGRLQYHTVPAGSTTPTAQLTRVTQDKSRAIGRWLAAYWREAGRCVPQYAPLFEPGIYQRAFYGGTSGVLISEVILNAADTSYILDKLPYWRDEVRSRLREVSLLLDQAYRYLDRLSLLPEVDQRAMWSFGERELASRLRLPLGSSIPSPYDLPPFPAFSNSRLSDMYRDCPSLRLWFGDYTPSRLLFVWRTVGLLMRRFAYGFYKPSWVEKLYYYIDFQGALDYHIHYPRGDIYLRGFYKDGDAWKRRRDLMHEAMHWLWYGSTKPFKVGNLIHNQGLPRDVVSILCGPGDDAKTCYQTRRPASLVPRGSPLAEQNIDNVVNWVLAINRHNERKGVDDISTGRLAGWVAPNVEDEWVQPPFRSPLSIPDYLGDLPGSRFDECASPPGIEVSAPSVRIARDDFCT